MQESETFCLQCQQASRKPANRLVQDSCGHKKCRSCLLTDVDKCKQCLGLVSFAEMVTATENSCKNTNYHTAVIQCNGKAKLNCDKGLEEPNDKQENDNNIEQDRNVAENVQKSDKKVGKRKTIPIPTHVIVKTDPMSYFCTICDKTFLTRTHVRYHQYCASEFKPYKCSECAKEFITKAQLNVHMFNHSETKPFSCLVCQKSFTEKSKLNRHMLMHSSEKKFVCSECAKSFKCKESLRLHVLIHRNEKPFACNVCSSKFNNSSNLKKHLVSHTNERAHMCDTCGRRFKLKWALSVHTKSHLKLRPHKCIVCSKSFVNFKDLQRHNLIHADSKGYSCGICNTGFKRKDNLHRHMKNSHPGKTADVIEHPTIKPVVPVDNPNAIKVITTAPQSSAKSTDSRPTGSVINGPIKLAFKTPAFKSHYNIARDCNFLSSGQASKPLPLSETVDLGSKRLDSKLSSSGICQKILALPNSISEQSVLNPSMPVSMPQPSFNFHYETSFQNRKHAMIKNIKFKVPEQYTTNLFKHNNNNKMTELNANSDLARTNCNEMLNTSVIVNTGNVGQTSDVHWRRRTSQNLVLKN